MTPSVMSCRQVCSSQLPLPADGIGAGRSGRARWSATKISSVCRSVVSSPARPSVLSVASASAASASASGASGGSCPWTSPAPCRPPGTDRTATPPTMAEAVTTSPVLGAEHNGPSIAAATPDPSRTERRSGPVSPLPAPSEGCIVAQSVGDVKSIGQLAHAGHCCLRAPSPIIGASHPLPARPGLEARPNCPTNSPSGP